MNFPVRSVRQAARQVQRCADRYRKSALVPDQQQRKQSQRAQSDEREASNSLQHSNFLPARCVHTGALIQLQDAPVSRPARPFGFVLRTSEVFVRCPCVEWNLGNRLKSSRKRRANLAGSFALRPLVSRSASSPRSCGRSRPIRISHFTPATTFEPAGDGFQARRQIRRPRLSAPSWPR
ncbi:MAG: hypothetical protein JWM91_4900 [Rhodospirillales bacterium]|nr:hypothetical protein [Rhodospirillales bacterium]